jgi:rod shape-determining protein MreD
VSVVRVLLVMAVALVLQLALAQWTIGGRWVFDLVLVGVVYAALQWGPVSGMMAGTLGGLTQDALSGEILGIGSFAKTVAGLGVGIAGAQFVVSGAGGRLATLAVATVGHRLLVASLMALLDARWSGLSWTSMLVEVVCNSVAGFVVFQATDMLPGAVRQTRERTRSSLSKRRW